MNTFIYLNLVNKKWSIKQSATTFAKGVVVGHCDACSLIDATPHVSGSHARVRACKTREVFAWIQGTLCDVEGFVAFRGRSVVTVDTDVEWGACSERVTFRPFEDECRGFHYVESGDAFESAIECIFTADKGMYV